MSVFSEGLKSLRQSQGLSLEQLGNKLGISKSTVNMYERGEREPSFEILKKIADFFKVDMNFLVNGISAYENQEDLMRDMTENECIGSRIRERRKELGLRLEDVANEIGYNKTTVMRYETGLIDNVRPSMIKQFADALNCTTDFLLYGTSKQEEVKKVNNPLFYTPEEAETAVKAYGQRGPTAEAIRYQAKEDPRKLGFPVSVIGSRVYIPRHTFNKFFGIGGENECGSLE